MAAPDPIGDIQARLWTLLESRSDFTDLVTPKNRIKDAESDSQRSGRELGEGTRAGDTPRVRIMPATAPLSLWNTSSSSKVVWQFRIEVDTGEKRPASILLPLCFAITRAIGNWQDATAGLTTLEWPAGYTYVKHVEFHSIEAERGPGKTEDLPRGFSAVGAVDIECWWQTSVLTGA